MKIQIRMMKNLYLNKIKILNNSLDLLKEEK